MKKSIYARKTQVFDLPTKWLFFYIFIRFPLIFLSSAITLINTYAPTIPYLFGGYLPPVFYLALLVDLAYVAFGIITFIKLPKLSPSSFKWNMVYLWFGVAYEILIMLVGRSFSPYMLGRVAGAFIWAIANLSYFNNRSELFDMEVPPETPYTPNYDYVQQPIAPSQNIQNFSGAANPYSNIHLNQQPAQSVPASSPEATPNAAVKFCPKCGNSLMAGAKFCNRCGAQIISQAEENHHEM